ncbi:MAG: carbon-nitrogen hydrolase family protein [Bacteroidia bacterium]|nr:carbon-nitrogen hydrolase family protein [Bacteroidia bacterium]
MKPNYFIRLLFVLTFFILNIIVADCAFSERFVKVATIGNTPPVIESDNKQEIVDHVIRFWDDELKAVLRKKPDLIVLPELCDLSLAGEEYLSVRKNQVLDHFASIAKKYKCYIAFGMQRKDDKELWRNSVVMLGRNGQIAGIYDKNFPTIGEMQIGIKASDEANIIETDFGRVAIAICFDLNFDELLKEYAIQKPDLIILSSMYHGGLAQSVWAYTCQSYFVGSVYRGYPSQIRDPFGEVIASSTSQNDYALETINLDFKRVHLAYNILNLAALKKKYGKSVKISDPGEYASVIVSSENENVSVDEMIHEFEIVEFNEYLDQIREFRREDGNLE